MLPGHESQDQRIKRAGVRKTSLKQSSQVAGCKHLAVDFSLVLV